MVTESASNSRGSRIVKWLLLARGVAENEQQRAAIEKLIAYYNSGDLAKFDEYNIAWVADTQSRFDLAEFRRLERFAPAPDPWPRLVALLPERDAPLTTR